MTTSNLRIEQRPAQPAIAIEVETTDVGATLQELLPASFAWVEDHGGVVAGPPFTRYLVIGATMRIQAGVPTAEYMQGDDRVQGVELPGGELAVGDHHGPYDTVVETAKGLREYIDAQGRTPSGPLWENYITDPGAEPDPARWHTEVCYPLS
jgi:AraC family transcriptional regulator